MSTDDERVEVWATVQVPGFHRWPDAPDYRAYLRDRHRHLFHVRVAVSVSQYSREVEFHDLQDEMLRHLGALSDGGVDFGIWSCETIARALGRSLRSDGLAVSQVEVSEDGENGAIVRFIR